MLAAACVAIAPGAAPAQQSSAPTPTPWDPNSDLRNPQIDIEYVEPRDAAFKPIQERLKRRLVLEELRAFLAPLKLPGKLVIKTDECGGLTSPYRAGGPAVICYEYVARIEAFAPAYAAVPIGVDWEKRQYQGILLQDELLVGPFVMLALHEVTLAAFDLLQVPIWGNVEDAADRVAGFLMTQFGKEVTWVTLMSSAWYLSQSGMGGGPSDFTYARNVDARRFYNYVCMAFASDPKAYQFMVNNKTVSNYRAGWCVEDYEQVRSAFNQILLPYIDPELLKRVRATQWIPSRSR
jgi:hypothetical protein